VGGVAEKNGVVQRVGPPRPIKFVKRLDPVLKLGVGCGIFRVMVVKPVNIRLEVWKLLKIVVEFGDSEARGQVRKEIVENCDFFIYPCLAFLP